MKNELIITDKIKVTADLDCYVIYMMSEEKEGKVRKGDGWKVHCFPSSVQSLFNTLAEIHVRENIGDLKKACELIESTRKIITNFMSITSLDARYFKSDSKG